MKAFVHSIHSQVPNTIAKISEDFEIVVSMDSHLDLSLGMDVSVYPEELKQTAARTSVHTKLRRLTGDLPGLRTEEQFVSEFIITISDLSLKDINKQPHCLLI